MEEKQQEKYQYLVPRNVNARFTFFEGFGWKELFLCLVGAAVGAVLFLLLSLFLKNIIARLIISIFPVVLAFVVSKENPRTGLSLLNLLKDFRQFVGQQKLYLYYHGKGRDR